MDLEQVATSAVSDETVLQIYLLGVVDFEAALLFQRRLHYEVMGNRQQAALILCEHPPLVTVGREGSHAHILCEPEELQARQWDVRWVNRGGGCVLHVPGQFAIYPILPLDAFGLGLTEYQIQLQTVIQNVLDDFSVKSQTQPHRPGVWVGNRLAAAVGVSVREWVSYFGAYLNVFPDLPSFRLFRWCDDVEPMTSLVRERRAPVRGSMVRERLIEHFTNQFAFGRTAYFSGHPALDQYEESCRKPSPAYSIH